MNKKLKPWDDAKYFLEFVFIAYISVFIYSLNLFYSILFESLTIFITVLPIFILIFFIMIVTNCFITSHFIEKHLKDKGIKKWIFIIIGGILSSGPIYMWYPLLSDLKKKGLSSGLIACFLYNRSIKLPLLPLIILYFGIKYTIVLTVVMIIVSIMQGLIINKIFEVKQWN